MKRLPNFVITALVIGLLGGLSGLSLAQDTRAADPPAEAEPKAKEKEENKGADWGAIFRMHYQNRVRSFREQNRNWKYVVLLGDSITEGFDLDTYFPGRAMLNRGISADVIGNNMPQEDPRGVLNRLDESVFGIAASDVFLLIGINDLNYGRDVDTMEAAYRELLKRLTETRPDVRFHVQSLLPTRGAHAGRNKDVVEFNARLRKLAGEFGCQYLDLHSLMIDDAGELKSEFTADGLHLTEPAYQVWKAEIEKAMGW